ncbi:hypothetical protein [Solilutibacter pythonis]|nr:hypothetical protein [Lysobacter pythonis]
MQTRFRRGWQDAALMILAGILAACSPSPTPAAGDLRAPVQAGAATPDAAVGELIEHLRYNDLAAIPRIGLPPALHDEVAAAWRRGESRWPLTELPLDDNLPKLLAALTRPQAERQLHAVFRGQISGQTPALQEAARGLGVFGKEYLGREGRYNTRQRQHYTQLIDALASWASQAPLGEPERGRQGVALLVKGAERSGITGDADFSRLGMEASLKALVPLYIASKQFLGLYGLGVDATLAGVEVETVETEGDRAEVRVRYELAGREVRTVMDAVRIDGRWYLTDYVEAARASLAPAAALSEAVTPTGR